MNPIHNTVPAHKKGDKMLAKNYLPISLFPNFGKMVERVIYNSLFDSFLSNRSFIPFQSGFLPEDSCIAQLLTVNNSWNSNCFLDISKVFN